MPFASSFPSSQLIHLLSQGFVVLRPRFGGRGVSNSGWSWSGVPTSQNAEVNQGQWGTQGKASGGEVYLVTDAVKNASRVTCVQFYCY